MAMQDLTRDHSEIYDTLVARRYFAKFDRIIGYLGRVAAELEGDARLTRIEARAVAEYVEALNRSFRALSLKYLMTGRMDGRTRSAIRRYQAARGLDSDIFALDSARALGLVALPRSE